MGEIRSGWAMALMAAAAFGCAASEGPRGATRFDPDVRLDALLVEWQMQPDPGLSCEMRPRERAAVTDCGRVRGEVEQLALEFPQHPRVRLAAAALAHDVRDRIRAQSHLDALFAAQPVHPEAAVLRARLAIEDGNVALARRVLREQIALTPDHPGLREAEAGVHYLAGDRSLATASLDAAEALGAPGWRIAYHRGLLDEAAGDRASALDQYRLAAEENPAFAPAREREAGLTAEIGW